MGLSLCKQLIKIQTGPLTPYGDISVLSVPSMGCVQSKEEIDFEETKALLLHNIAEAEKEIKAREESSAEKEKEKGPKNMVQPLAEISICRTWFGRIPTLESPSLWPWTM